MSVEYLTTMSDTSYVKRISAECLSNIRRMSVEYLPNVCRISDNYVRQLLCQPNIRRMSVEYAPNVCRISDNNVRHFLCQMNICQTYPVKRGTGACVLRFEGISVAGASPEASRFEQAVCVTDRQVGVAAVLLQENDGKLYPVGYASKKLNLTEARYPIIEKECFTLLGWKKIYAPDKPQALEIPKGCSIPKRPSV